MTEKLDGGEVGHPRQRFRVGSPQDTAFGDDSGDVLCRSDVKGGILNGDVVWGHLAAAVVGDFLGSALFDGNLSPVGVLRSMVDQGAAT